MTRPLVLLTNDDGYRSQGLDAVRVALSAWADVVVCAPESNQSATSHSLTLHRVLRLREVSRGVHALDGTPADCVYVALHSGSRVLPRRPDLCVSGMNLGLNLGVDVFYSGTVAAAREAALRGIPSLALSADSNADLTAAAALGSRLAERLLAESGDEPRGQRGTSSLLNVNFPPGAAWPVRSTTLGHRTYEGEAQFRTDPRGAEYLWIGGTHAVHHDSPGSDTEAYDARVVGITPLALHLDEPKLRRLAQSLADSVS
jgi:5'-nucleotidase